MSRPFENFVWNLVIQRYIRKLRIVFVRGNGFITLLCNRNEQCPQLDIVIFDIAD